MSGSVTRRALKRATPAAVRRLAAWLGVRADGMSHREAVRWAWDALRRLRRV